MIDNLLNQSLDSCEQDSLIAAFLLARQAANEGPHVFQSYPQWFRGHFGEGTSRLGNKKAVAFFLAFLTSLVPHEPAEYLKVCEIQTNKKKLYNQKIVFLKTFSG